MSSNGHGNGESASVRPGTEAEEGATEDVVRQRVYDLGSFLEHNAVSPAMIDISRSVRSGYTPQHLSEHIESTLLEMLRTRYDLDVL